MSTCRVVSQRPPGPGPPPFPVLLPSPPVVTPRVGRLTQPAAGVSVDWNPHPGVVLNRSVHDTLQAGDSRAGHARLARTASLGSEGPRYAANETIVQVVIITVRVVIV